MSRDKGGWDRNRVTSEVDGCHRPQGLQYPSHYEAIGWKQVARGEIFRSLRGVRFESEFKV